MRIILFIILFCIAFIPKVFADSTSKHNWTGMYTGIILGRHSSNSSDKTGAFGYNADNNKWDYNESGANAGAQIGYNYPWQDLVVGPEIELGYLNINGSAAQPAAPNGDTVGKFNNDFYTAFRVRLGVDLDRYVLFATGGAIGVNGTNQVVDSCSIAPCGGATMNAKKSNFIWGYTIGGGVERWFDKGWSAKLECLYFNLNNQSFNGTTNLGNTYYWTGQTSGYIFRVGINYSF